MAIFVSYSNNFNIQNKILQPDNSKFKFTQNWSSLTGNEPQFRDLTQLQFEFTNGYEMMHKTWSSTEEVPYCFSRSSV